MCDLLTDVAMPLRALAAEMLGDFHSVSPQLLDQTLDKKLMSHLKVQYVCMYVHVYMYMCIVHMNNFIHVYIHTLQHTKERDKDIIICMIITFNSFNFDKTGSENIGWREGRREEGRKG